MSDWQVGDLAVCVNAAVFCCGRVIHTGACIPKGAVIRVTHIVRDDCGCLCLGNATYIANNGSPPLASRFRKIRPDAHEGNVEDWNLILENSKRKAPSPMERERMMLDALFPQTNSHEGGRGEQSSR